MPVSTLAYRLAPEMARIFVTVQVMSRVLIVEDDDATRVLLKAVCTRAGLEADCATDGLDGVRMLKANRYDGLVLDLMLPHLNGFELLREVRAHCPELLPRTVIITAASDGTLRNFDGGGAFHLIRKPFDVVALTDALLACTNGHSEHT